MFEISFHYGKPLNRKTKTNYAVDYGINVENVDLYLTAILVQKHHQKSILQRQIVLTVDPRNPSSGHRSFLRTSDSKKD